MLLWKKRITDYYIVIVNSCDVTFERYKIVIERKEGGNAEDGFINLLGDYYYYCHCMLNLKLKVRIKNIRKFVQHQE